MMPSDLVILDAKAPRLESLLRVGAFPTRVKQPSEGQFGDPIDQETQQGGRLFLDTTYDAKRAKPQTAS